MDPDNDADWEMLAIAEVTRDIANGVCPICDEALQPGLARWALLPEEVVMLEAAYGPPHPDVPHCHTKCVEDDQRDG